MDGAGQREERICLPEEATEHPCATPDTEPGAIPGGSSRPGRQGRYIPSPTHGNTTAGEKAVVLREFIHFHYSKMVKK